MSCNQHEKKKNPVDFLFAPLDSIHFSNWVSDNIYVFCVLNFHVLRDEICSVVSLNSMRLHVHIRANHHLVAQSSNISYCHRTSEIAKSKFIQWNFIRVVDSQRGIHVPQWRILWRRFHLYTARYYWLFARCIYRMVHEFMLRRNTTFCVCVHTWRWWCVHTFTAFSQYYILRQVRLDAIHNSRWDFHVIFFISV